MRTSLSSTRPLIFMLAAALWLGCPQAGARPDAFRQHFQRASGLYQAGQYEEAIKERR